MYVRNFRFNKESLHDFIAYGDSLYRDDGNYIAQPEEEMLRLLSSSYPFYQKPGNDHRNFILYDNDKPVGRTTAFINSSMLNSNNEPIGTIGFFECNNSYTYAQTLLDEAVRYFKNKSISNIRGPMSFDIWHNYRFMTKGFSEPTFYGEPYNKSYYPYFFERYGFKTEAEWDSVEIIGTDLLQAMIEKGAKRYNLLKNKGYRFEFFDPDHYECEIEKLHVIIKKSFEGFLGYTPISLEELFHLFEKAKFAINHRLILYTYNSNDELCGFAVALPELADAIRAATNRYSLIRKLQFRQKYKKIHKVNFYLGGTIPDEIKNRSGLGRAGFYVIVNEILKAGYDTLLLTLRLKGNAAHGLPGRFSPEPQKEYKLYGYRV